MPNSYVALGDAVVQDEEAGSHPLASKFGSGKGKTLALISFVSGLGFMALLSGGARSLLAPQNPIIFAALSSTTSSYSIASLPGPPALKDRAIKAIEASRSCRRVRDVSMKAEGEMTAAGDGKPYYKLMASSKTEPLTRAQVEEMPGITAPLGLFDPFAISTKVPEGQLLFYREAELKHGRVCMLAILGLIVGDTHNFFPFLNTGIDPSLPAWVWASPLTRSVPQVEQFWGLLLAGLFVEEWRHEAYRKANPDAAPGDYGWDPLGMKPKDAKGLKELQNKELNNGRLAMFAAAGIIAQEQLTGQKLYPFV